MRLWLWFIFVAMLPLYAFPSGLPQPADGVMVLLVLITLARGRIRVPATLKWPLVFAGGFVGYTVLVNATWTQVLGDLSPLRSSLFYFYNLLVMLVTANLRNEYKDRFWRYTLIALVCAVALQLVYVSGAGTRFTGTFNNPNQLGYFTVLASAVVYICIERLPGSRSLWFPLILPVMIYLALLSLSRAALGSMALMLLIYSGVVVMRRRIGLALFISAALVLAAPSLVDSQLARSVEARLTAKSHDTLVQRGYERIADYPNLAILGAGEGAMWRFMARGYMELHSTLGTVLFSYGIPGMVLFGGLLLTVGRKGRLDFALLIVPVMVYTLSHQGLRFTLFWVFLATITADTEAMPSRCRAATPVLDRRGTIQPLAVTGKYDYS